MTFNDLRHGRFNSAIARRLLSLYFREGRVYRVHLGPLKGVRLYYDRTVNFHAILGLWDAAEYAFLDQVLSRGGFLQPGLVVADVGANLGIFSLWVSRLLDGLAHQVFAFEPAPDTFEKLRTNLSLNDAASVATIPMACSATSGSVELFIGHHHHVSSLLKEWAHAEQADGHAVTVQATSLDRFFESDGREYPHFIKMDIEGGGVFALRGCGTTFATRRPLLWIESHTPEEDRAISDVLVTFDYEAYRFTNRRPVTRPAETHPAPDGVWGTLLLYPREMERRVTDALS